MALDKSTISPVYTYILLQRPIEISFLFQVQIYMNVCTDVLMYGCIYIYICVCVCVCVYECVNIYIYIYIYMYVCICMYVCMYVCMDARMYVCIVYVYVFYFSQI